MKEHIAPRLKRTHAEEQRSRYKQGATKRPPPKKILVDFNHVQENQHVDPTAVFAAAGPVQRYSKYELIIII